MKLATIRDGDRTMAVRIDGDEAIELGVADVGEVLRRDDWRRGPSRLTVLDGRRTDLGYATLVPRPDKVLCVGLNYRNHILEMGRELPDHPTLFAKYRATLIGAHDDILLPAVSDQVDWEAELAVIIGAPARHVSVERAGAYIAGYSVANDVSVRDYQYRTLQWLQGKMFEATTPVGPHLVTVDEAGGPSHEIVVRSRRRVDAEGRRCGPRLRSRGVGVLHLVDHHARAR